MTTKLSRTTRRTILALAGTGLVAKGRPAVAGPAPSGHWQSWRGPLHSGEAPGAKPPLAFGEKQNLKWKTRLPGRGTGTPIVWGDRIFLQSAISVGEAGAPPAVGAFGALGKPNQPFRFVLLCLDRRSGKLLWQKVAREEVPHEGHHQDHGYASYSPVTDGKRLWVSFGSHGVYCFDLGGNLKWEKDLGRMQTRNGFGEGSSPAVHGNTVVVNWDHEGSDFIVALDAQSGKELWRQVRDEPTTWATPLIVTHQGKAQVVTAGTQRVRAYDLETGRMIWDCAGLTLNSIPSPVSSRGVVYAMAGFRGSMVRAIRLGGSGDLTNAPEMLWTYDKYTPYVPSPLLLGERLYFFSGNTGILTVIHTPTGRRLVEAVRVPGLEAGVYASPVAADGRVYLVGRNGSVVVIRDADQLEVLASTKLDERVDASPALVGSDLLIRGHDSLYCFGNS